MNGDVRVVKMLLDAGAAMDDDPLGTPIREGNLEMVRLLVAHGCKTNSEQVKDHVQSADRTDPRVAAVVNWLINEGGLEDPFGINDNEYLERDLLLSAVNEESNQEDE